MSSQEIIDLGELQESEKGRDQVATLWGRTELCNRDGGMKSTKSIKKKDAIIISGENIT